MNPDSKNAGEIILATLEELNKRLAEAEAKKTPQQKAEEQQRWKVQREAAAIAKAQKKREELFKLYKSWCLRDTWLVESEAMHLIAGRDPFNITIFDGIDQDLWELVKSCAGHSLKVLNPNENSGQWRVLPSEWVRWAKQKDLPVPEELTDLIFPQLPNKPSISKAQETREQKKRERQRFLKSFAFNIESKAREKNIPWDSKAIPVTKDEFLDFFYSQCPQIGKISRFTFDHDIAEIGLKFKPGTKTNPDNALARIYS